MNENIDLVRNFHRFFIGNAYRALNDADALLYLISLQDEDTGSPYFKELIDNARRSTVNVKATHASFDSKELLKKRGYSWDSINKNWFKSTYKDEMEYEISWLEKNVYKGSFLGSTREIRVMDNFKS